MQNLEHRSRRVRKTRVSTKWLVAEIANQPVVGGVWGTKEGAAEPRGARAKRLRGDARADKELLGAGSAAGKELLGAGPARK